MRWPSQPSFRGGGNLHKESRAEHYANPPSNPGLCGLQIDTPADKRTCYVRDGVVGTSSTMARKGEPFR